MLLTYSFQVVHCSHIRVVLCTSYTLHDSEIDSIHDDRWLPQQFPRTIDADAYNVGPLILQKAW